VPSALYQEAKLRNDFTRSVSGFLPGRTLLTFLSRRIDLLNVFACQERAGFALFDVHWSVLFRWALLYSPVGAFLEKSEYQVLVDGSVSHLSDTVHSGSGAG